MSVTLGGAGAGGGGAGFALGPAQNTFNAATKAAGVTARDTYSTNNSDWLAQYDANPNSLVRVTWPATPANEAFYGRADSAWVELTAVVRGPRGLKGDTGTGVPDVTGSDNGSVLRVVSSAWAKVTSLPASIIGSGVLAAARIPTVSLSKLASNVQARLLPTGATSGQVAKWSGTAWEAADDETGSGGSGGEITVADEGTDLSTAATTLDFRGAGVTASGTGATKTISIPGGQSLSDQAIGEKAFENPPDDLTATEKTSVRTAIGAGTSSFSGAYSDLTGKPTIPQDSTIFKGAWVANTVYAAGDIVTYDSKVYLCITTNSDATFMASKWEQLDVGSPEDIVGVSVSGVTFTFTKRDGTTQAVTPNVQDGAQKNRPIRKMFAVLAGDTNPSSALAAAEIGFYQANGTTQITSGNISSAAVLYLPKQAAATGNDVSNPNTDVDAIDLESFFGGVLDNPGTGILLAMSKRGSSNRFYAHARTVAAYGTTGYKLSNIIWYGDDTFATTTYNVVLGPAVAAVVDAIIGGDQRWVRLDGSNLTALFRSEVQLSNEEYDLPVVQTRVANDGVVAADNQFRFVEDPVLKGASVGIVWRLPQASYDEVVQRWAVRNWLKIGTGTFRIKGGVNELGNRTLQANVQLIEGLPPAVSGNALIYGNDVHRGELTLLSFLNELAGNGGKYLRIKSDASDVEAVDGVSSGDFEELLDIEFPYHFTVAWAGNVSNDNEAVVSTDNSPANQKFGVDTFIGVKKPEGADRDLIDTIEAGDYLLAKKGDTHILTAEIAGRDIAPLSDIRRLWVKDVLYTRGLDDYDDFPTGAGEIRFSKAQNAADVAVDASGFDGNLSTTDDTVQKVAQKLDDLDLGSDAVADYQASAPSNPKTGQMWWDSDSETSGLATKRGTHRRNVTELSATTSALPGVSLMTCAYTPEAANARMWVKLRIVAAVQGNSDNDYAGLTVRVKRGTGNWKRIDEGADGYTKVWWKRMWQYWDTGADVYQDEFMLEPKNDTGEVKVNVSLYSQDGATVQNVAGRLNRTVGAAVRNAGPSFIEIWEMTPGGSMTYETATTLDSA